MNDCGILSVVYSRFTHLCPLVFWQSCCPQWKNNEVTEDHQIPFLDANVSGVLGINYQIIFLYLKLITDKKLEVLQRKPLYFMMEEKVPLEISLEEIIPDSYWDDTVHPTAYQR